MGSFNTICCVSKHIISCGEPVVLIPVIPVANSISAAPGCYIHDRYKYAMHIPLSARYNDYGGFLIEEDDAYEAFKDMVVNNYIMNEVEEGKVLDDYNQYHDYMEVSVDKLFVDDVFQDMMHDQRLFIKPYTNYFGEKKVPLMWMVVKRKVYDLMVLEHEPLVTGDWTEKYIREREQGIRESFAEIASMSVLSEEEQKAEIEERRAKMIEIFKNAPGLADIYDGMTSSIRSKYNTAVGFTSDGPYAMSNVTDKVASITAKNIEKFLQLQRFSYMLVRLHIEINVQQYGSQEYDHLYHADMMTRIMIAGVQNDEDINFSVTPILEIGLDVEAVDEYCTVEKWRDSCDLVRDSSGKLVASGEKYAKFNDCKTLNFRELK